jgi:hypothetical protein
VCNDAVACGPTEKCDPQKARCVPKKAVCGDASDCQAGEFCQSPKTYCDRFENDLVGCDAQPRCLPSSACLPDCRRFDRDEVACGAVADCVFDAQNGLCEAGPNHLNDCSAFGDDNAACEDSGFCWPKSFCDVRPPPCSSAASAEACVHPGCYWDANANTGLGLCLVKGNQCVPQSRAGERCSKALVPHGSPDCASAACSPDTQGDYRCEVDALRPGHNDIDLLSHIFVFGAVVISAQRWRRHKLR